MVHRQPVRSGGGTTSGGATNGGAASARDIPDKLYFRIGEVARLCEVPAYVLRFWESEFPQLKPNKGGTGQRLYRRRDVEMALRVKTLLYDEGYTIAGARQVFKSEQRRKDLKEPQLALGIEETGGRADLHKLRRLRNEMQELLTMLSAPALAKSKGAPVQSIRPVKPKRSVMDAEPGNLFE